MADRNEGRRFTDQGGNVETVIGKGSHVEGEITGSTSIEVWGSVTGTARIDGLCWVREGGRFNGDIFATGVVVEGEVHGKITAADKVELRASCRSQGSISAGSLAIADGSFFEGAIQMRDAGKGSTGQSAKKSGSVGFQEKRRQEP